MARARGQGDKVTREQSSGLRYIGEGAFLPGVPARDLSAAEVVLYAVQLEEAQQAGTLAMLYQPVDGVDRGKGEEEVNA